MNTKFKNNQGITLIALIITIIILVILAAVSIRAVTNMGIVGHAINGTQDYARATVQEQAELREAAIKTTIAEYRLKNILDNVDLKSFLESKGYEVIDNGDGSLSFDMDGYTITVDEENLSYTSEKNNNMARIAFLKDGSKTSVVAPNDTVTVSLKFGDNVDVANTKYLYTSSATVENTAITGSLPNSNQEQTITTGLDTSTIGTKYFYLLVAYKDGTESTRKVESLQIGTPVTSIGIYKDGQEASAAVAAITGETLKGTKTLTLHAVVEPDNATLKTVTWESSDTSVATVANGVVTAADVEEAGTVTITARANGGANVTATCEIAVTPKPTMSVAFSQNGEDYTWEDVHKMAKIISGMFAVWGENDTAEQKATKINKLSDSVTIEYPTGSNTNVTLTVGQTMTLKDTSATPNTYTVRILGFNTDKLASTSNVAGDTTYTGTYAGISFEFVTFLKYNNSSTTKRMTPSDDDNPNGTNVGGWEMTEMRSNLNDLDDTNSAKGIGLLENKDYIKYVTKTYNKGNKGKDTDTCTDRLWLLACSEIWATGYTTGAYGYCNTNESTVTTGITETRYAYYASQGTPAVYSSASDVTKKPSTTSASHWWLRSPRCNNTTNFCIVHNDGYCNFSSAYDSAIGVAPGFSI